MYKFMFVIWWVSLTPKPPRQRRASCTGVWGISFKNTHTHITRQNGTDRRDSLWCHIYRTVSLHYYRTVGSARVKQHWTSDIWIKRINWTRLAKLHHQRLWETCCSVKWISWMTPTLHGTWRYLYFIYSPFFVSSFTLQETNYIFLL